MEATAKTDVSSKLEDLFLKILRIVILVVLVLTLLGALAFGLKGLSGMTSSPKEYDYQSPKTEDLVREIKNSLKGVDNNETKGAAPGPATSSPENSPLLEQEVDKQVKLLSDFLARFELSLSNPDAIRNGLLRESRTLAFEPEDPSSVMQYATGQTKFFEIILSDKEILDLLIKDREPLNRFFNMVTSSYDSFHEDQKKEARSFEKEEAGRVAVSQIGSTLDLYIAAGMFISFLLISLILVLVKIERNLRTRPI